MADEHLKTAACYLDRADAIQPHPGQKALVALAQVHATLALGEKITELIGALEATHA